LKKVDELARRIDECESDAEAARLNGELALAAGADPQLLPMLLRDRRHRVREFAVGQAEAVLGKGAAPLLVDVYRRDSDPDIRADALQRALKLDPRAASGIIPRLRRQLHSKDFYEPVDAMWALLELRDIDSEPLIASVRQARTDWTGKVAQIVSMALRGDEEGIASQLLGHDHFASSWLARAAASLGTPALLDAIKTAANELPDEECRSQCAHWLK
jgi:hypothetical protein